MKKHFLLTALLSAFILTIASGQTTAPSPASLMKERLEMKQTVRKINEEKDKATANLTAEYFALDSLANAYRQPPMTDAQVASAKSQQDSLRQQIESCQQQLKALDRKLESAAIKDPADRAAKAKEVALQSQDANKKMFEALAPFTKRANEAMAPLQKTDADFNALLDKCFKDSSDKFAGATHQKSDWSNYAASGQIHWKLADGKDAAWGALFLQDNAYPAPTASPGTKLIDGKYTYSYNYNHVWVQAGYFNISLDINKKEWQSDEAAAVTLIQNLIDLDALAKLKPQ